MDRKRQSSTTSFALRSMTLLISFCYLANPIHQQIGSVFHEFSHVVQSTYTLALYDEPHGHAHESNHHDTHHSTAGNHQHEVLDFIEAIFGASDENSLENEKALVLKKFDKHINSELILLRKLFPIITSVASFTTEQKVQRGFLYPSKKPPQ